MVKRASNVIAFTAEVERVPVKGGWTFVEFPHDVEELFGKRGAVRVRGTVNGTPMERALMPAKSGRHIIVLGADLRRQARIGVGDTVAIEIWRDPQADAVHVPEELADTLDFMPAFKRAWAGLNTGMQRSLCYWIASGKAPATRARRVADLLRRSEEGVQPFGPKPAQRAR